MIKKHGGNVHQFSLEHGVPVEKIKDFSANINPLGIPSSVKEAFEQPELILNYPDPNYEQLTEAVSNFESVPKEYLIFGNGGIECIFLLAESLKNKKFLIPSPTFVEYERAFSKYGEVSTCLLEYPFELDVHQIKSEMNDCDGVIICNPNNPTGFLIRRHFILELLEAVDGRMVIVDEAFIDFTDDEAENTMTPYLSKYDNLVILKSMTKFFAMPGLRLGYLMTSNQKILNEIKSNRMPWSINGIAAYVGAHVVKDSTYILKTKAFIKEERTFLYHELLKLGLDVLPSQGNYLFFSCDESIDEKISKYGIMVRNCNNYLGLNDSYYRVAIKNRQHNQVLIQALKEILWTL